MSAPHTAPPLCAIQFCEHDESSMIHDPRNKGHLFRNGIYGHAFVAPSIERTTAQQKLLRDRERYVREAESLAGFGDDNSRTRRGVCKWEIEQIDRRLARDKLYDEWTDADFLTERVTRALMPQEAERVRKIAATLAARAPSSEPAPTLCGGGCHELRGHDGPCCQTTGCDSTCADNVSEVAARVAEGPPSAKDARRIPHCCHGNELAKCMDEECWRLADRLEKRGELPNHSSALPDAPTSGGENPSGDGERALPLEKLYARVETELAKSRQNKAQIVSPLSAEETLRVLGELRSLRDAATALMDACIPCPPDAGANTVIAYIETYRERLAALRAALPSTLNDNG